MKRCASIFRCGRRGTDGLSCAMVSGGPRGAGCAGLRSFAAEACDHTAAGEFIDVLRARAAELDAAPAVAVSAALRSADRSIAACGAGVCGPICAAARGGSGRAFAADRTGRFLQYACGDTVRGCEAAGAGGVGRKTALAEGAGDGAWGAVRGTDAADY